jgi:hypothetical protein
MNCGNVFTLKEGYVCELPSNHSGKHSATCPNPQFTQEWEDEFGRADTQETRR